MDKMIMMLLTAILCGFMGHVILTAAMTSSDINFIPLFAFATIFVMAVTVIGIKDK